MRPVPLLLACVAAATAAEGAGAPDTQRRLPGLQEDGYTLLHSQWPIHPVGDQVVLGDFPVGMAIDPRGRLAAVLHAGHGRHEVRLVDIGSLRVVAEAPINETFCGVAFSSDGKSLFCSGGSDGVLHAFTLSADRLFARGDVRVADKDDSSVVAGFALSRDARSAVVALAFDSRVVRVNLETGARAWTAVLEGGERPRVRPSASAEEPNDVLAGRELVTDADPLNVIWDEPRARAYASLWGESGVAVIDTNDGRVIGRWPTGLHPNEMALSRDGRLFVANGGLNTVTVIDTGDGRVSEVLSSSFAPGDLPGSTPDSLALSRDGGTLYVANAYANTIAVFDISVRGGARPLGFVPTGWFPTAVRIAPDGMRLLVVSARGLVPKANPGLGPKRQKIDELYSGSLGVIRLPRGDAYARSLAEWTRIAQRCRPAPPDKAPGPGDPIPARPGDPSPIRYVVYVIKENRTYDQVFGDLKQGNGDPSLCLFPERATPNIHAIARQFVLLDNFYANAEVSASGHEWSMDRTSNPARNPYRRETLNIGVHAPMMRRCSMPISHLQKKSATRRTARTSGTGWFRVRGLCSLSGYAFTRYITPMLIREYRARKFISRRWKRRGRRKMIGWTGGVAPESALYLLPNAKSIRARESGSLALHLLHKWTMRTCFNAQEEIYQSSIEEVEQVRAAFRIGRYVGPPCYLRAGISTNLHGRLALLRCKSLGGFSQHPTPNLKSCRGDLVLTS